MITNKADFMQLLMVIEIEDDEHMAALITVLQKLKLIDFRATAKDMGLRVRTKGAYLSDGTYIPSVVNSVAPEKLADIEKKHIIVTLEHCEGSIAKTAKVLGITRATVYKKLERYGINNA